MRAGSIVLLAAALVPAPFALLAVPAAAAAQPVVSSVSPGSGTVGTSVTITGSGFDGGCAGGHTGQVFFNGIPATATVSDTSATAIAPANRAGPVDVRVADCQGDWSPITSADTFVYPSPVVSSISPGSGTVGTIVTITGSGFDYNCAAGQTGEVFFNGIPATATVSDTSATAIAPANRAGPVDVRVADCQGDWSPITSADTFVYPSPVVSSISPGSGTVGTKITITGSAFDYGCTAGHAGRVFFNGIPATATVSDTSATAIAPSNSMGPVDVRVTDCLGDWSQPTPADRYTYLARGPRFFGLRVYGTESRGATIIARLLKPDVLALRVMRVVSTGRLVFVGLVRFGLHPRGRSLIHWNFGIQHPLLGPGRYELTLHGSLAGVLSAPAPPGARTLVILTGHRVRLLR